MASYISSKHHQALPQVRASVAKQQLLATQHQPLSDKKGKPNNPLLRSSGVADVLFMQSAGEDGEV
jgi:hypothetical protein